MLTCDLGVIGVFIKQKIACTLQRVSGAGSGVAPRAVTLEIPADQLPARNVVRAQVRACSLDSLSLIVCDVLMGWFVRDLDLHSSPPIEHRHAFYI
jgi:hypothetical protein